ncbi:MAG: FAD-dependent oxidoreductase [Gemmataceae bacterium]|nr:FAD-binding oxidoreductase [Gemmata sp.]MDW8196098.1 FAD-dependent oxidoreductase [Gemmataceae bacterium]
MNPEFLIIGQGLAGTTLAWQLLRRGRRSCIVDRESGPSASRVAAGLMTPVTGKRLAKSWRWDELYPAAVAFYRWVEAETGERFFYPRPSLRLFASAAERDEFYRRETTLLRGLVRRVDDVPAVFTAPWGGFEMPDAARLDVPHYLDVSREYFRRRGLYHREQINPERPPAAGTVIFCRGFDPEPDPWFGRITFNAAKGEILTLRIPQLPESRVVHRGVWLVPVDVADATTNSASSSSLFYLGATHTWQPLDAVPTSEGRAELENKLREFLRVPYEIVGHRAAVRPVIDAGYPVLGRHPDFPQLAYFNGLGAKGSLLAPFFAHQLAAHLCGQGEIDETVHVRKYLCRDSLR